MFSENVEHFNKKTSKGAKYRVAQPPIYIKDENEGKYTSILNPGIKIRNDGRKSRMKEAIRNNFNDRTRKVGQQGYITVYVMYQVEVSPFDLSNY